MNDKTALLTKEWIRKAESDLKNIANNLRLPPEEIPTDTLCFHAQQASEKYLKAYLTYHSKEYPFTHNIAGLITVCSELDREFSVLSGEAETLTPYSVNIRYPESSSVPSFNEAKEAYEIALKIKEFVLEKIGGEYRIPFSNR